MKKKDKKINPKEDQTSRKRKQRQDGANRQQIAS